MLSAAADQKHTAACRTARGRGGNRALTLLPTVTDSNGEGAAAGLPRPQLAGPHRGSFSLSGSAAKRTSIPFAAIAGAPMGATRPPAEAADFSAATSEPASGPSHGYYVPPSAQQPPRNDEVDGDNDDDDARDVPVVSIDLRQ